MSPAAAQFEHRPRMPRRRRAVHGVASRQRLVTARRPLRGHPRSGAVVGLCRPGPRPPRASSRRISTVASARSSPGSVSASATSPDATPRSQAAHDVRKRDGPVRQPQVDAAVTMPRCADQAVAPSNRYRAGRSAASNVASGRTATGRVRSA